MPNLKSISFSLLRMMTVPVKGPGSAGRRISESSLSLLGEMEMDPDSAVRQESESSMSTGMAES